MYKNFFLCLIGLAFQVHVLKAQTTCNVNGVSISVTSTSGSSEYATPNINPSNCPLGAYTGFGRSAGVNGATLEYNFSSPVLSARVGVGALNPGDAPIISLNTGATFTLTNPCNLVILPGNQVDVNISQNNYTIGWVTVTSTTPFNFIRFSPPQNNGSFPFTMLNPCDITFTVAPNATCIAGTVAPRID